MMLFRPDRVLVGVGASEGSCPSELARGQAKAQDARPVNGAQMPEVTLHCPDGGKAGCLAAADPLTPE